MLFKVKLFRREKIEGPKKDTQLMHKNLGVLASSLSWNLWLVNYLPTEAVDLSQVLGCPGVLAELEPLAGEVDVLQVQRLHLQEHCPHGRDSLKREEPGEGGDLSCHLLSIVKYHKK